MLTVGHNRIVVENRQHVASTSGQRITSARSWGHVAEDAARLSVL